MMKINLSTLVGWMALRCLLWIWWWREECHCSYS